jgi:hypothetical protein
MIHRIAKKTINRKNFLLNSGFSFFHHVNPEIRRIKVQTFFLSFPFCLLTAFHAISMIAHNFIVRWDRDVSRRPPDGRRC